MAEAKKARKKPRTGTLPGIKAPAVIPELTEAAIAYESIRDNRMELTKDEVAAHATLVRLMTEQKLTNYVDNSLNPPVIVQLQRAEKAKVKRSSSTEED